MRHAWLIIAIVSAVVYSNSLNGDFHYDDEHSVEGNPNIRSLDNVGRFFVEPAMFSVDAEKGMYRPILLVTYAVNFALGEFDVGGYHVANVAIHAVNACLVWWLASLLGLPPNVALLAGLLFAVHPACTEPVNYISSRSESLAALFYLLAMALFLYGRGRGRLLPLVWCSMALGLLTKSTAITLPACLLVLDYLYGSRCDLAVLRSRLKTSHLVGWAVCAAYVGTIVLNGFLGRSAGNRVREWGEQLATQAKAPAYYLGLLATPLNLSVEPQFEAETSLLTGAALASMALVLSLAALVWLAWRWRARRVVFLMVWGGLVLAPVLIFPLNVLVNERRVYLSCAALCIGLASALPLSALRRHGRTILPAALLLVLGVLTFQRNRVWADDFSLWRDAVARGPLMPRPALYLGNAHKDAAFASPAESTALGHWRAAADQYRRVIELGTHGDLSVRALNNIGSVHFVLGEHALAEQAFRQAVDLNPDYADALINLASVTLTRARGIPDSRERRAAFAEVVTLYSRALELRPNHYQAHGNLGVVQQDLGQWDRARRSYERALALNPRDHSSLANLGGLALQAAGPQGADEGVLRQAASYFRRSLQLNPRHEPARRGLDEVARRRQSR